LQDHKISGKVIYGVSNIMDETKTKPDEPIQEETLVTRMYREIHEALGCDKCFFADPEKIYKADCCTYPGEITSDPKTAKCLRFWENDNGGHRD